MDKIFGLFGCGGHGRETIVHVQKFEKSKIKFVDDYEKKKNINGFEVITTNQFFDSQASEKYFNVSISDYAVRKKITDKLLDNNCIPFSIKSKTSIINNHTTIDEGLIISDYSYIASNVKVGKFFHLNRYSQVSHDCVIGNYVTFAPQVCCNGNVKVEDFVFIGCGALIKQGTSEKPITIGKGSVIGMGAVVTKSVDPYTIVLGNPARLSKKIFKK